MSIIKRYFRFTTGPVADEIDRLQDLLIAAHKRYHEIGEKCGAKEVQTYHSGGFAGFVFAETPDQDVYRFLKKHRLWVPRKNTPGGKAVWAQFQDIPRPDAIETALHLVDLTPGLPCLFDGGKWYAPVLWGFGKPTSVWYVSVPWQERDPEELKQYKLDRAAGGNCNSKLEHLQWEAPADWTEVKEWQITKEVEEIDAAKKAKAADVSDPK